MGRHWWQAALAAAVWTIVLVQAGVPLVLAVLIPVDVAILGLAALRWRALGSP
jgi:hypothetical protein